jgi:hypothetical protein
LKILFLKVFGKIIEKVQQIPLINHLIIWHLKSVVPRLEVLLFSRKSFVTETGRSQGHVQKGISRPFISYSINFFTYEDSENTEKDPDDPEPADIQMEYSSD